MAVPPWTVAALHDARFTPSQRLVLIELRRLAASGATEGNVQDVARDLGLDRMMVMSAILRLQHLQAIDLVLRDTRPATAWFDFGPAERPLPEPTLAWKDHVL